MADVTKIVEAPEAAPAPQTGMMPVIKAAPASETEAELRAQELQAEEDAKPELLKQLERVTDSKELRIRELELQLAKAKSDAEVAHRAAVAAALHRDRCDANVDALSAKLARTNPPKSVAQTNAEYLAAQRQEREDRVRRQADSAARRLKAYEMGLLEDEELIMLQPEKSPIEQAIAARIAKDKRDNPRAYLRGQ